MPSTAATQPVQTLSARRPRGRSILRAWRARPRLRLTEECKEREVVSKFHGLSAAGRHRFSAPAFSAFLYKLGGTFISVRTFYTRGYLRSRELQKSESTQPESLFRESNL